MNRPIDIAAIESEARRLRAEEMRHLQDLFNARLSVFAHLVAGTAQSLLKAIGDLLRPLFSWNPQGRHYS